MASLLLRTPQPRLERLLTRLGVDYEGRADLSAAAVGPGGEIDLRSQFTLHQARAVLAGLGLSPRDLEPADAEGEAWKAVLAELVDAPLIEGSGEPDAELAVLDGLEGALDVHQALELALVRHRLALMQADLPEAQSTWRVFARVMRHHIVVEDTLVTPRYEASEPAQGWERGAAPFILGNEHGKIRMRCDEFEHQLQTIADQDLPDGERAARCLELLDRQKVFADLLEHHDLRERAFVYRHLEGRLTEAQKAEIVLGLLAW